MSNKYVVVEHQGQSGWEVEIRDFRTAEAAFAYVDKQYDEQDCIELSPCVMKRLPDGELTTEF